MIFNVEGSKAFENLRFSSTVKNYDFDVTKSSKTESFWELENT